jgi:hypothetical protein
MLTAEKNSTMNFFLRVKGDFITQKGLQDTPVPVPET